MKIHIGADHAGFEMKNSLIDFLQEHKSKGPLEGRKLIFFSPNVHPSYVKDHYPEGVLLFHKWDDVVNELRKEHGAGTKAVVFPCASLQVDENVVTGEEFMEHEVNAPQ